MVMFRTSSKNGTAVRANRKFPEKGGSVSSPGLQHPRGADSGSSTVMKRTWRIFRHRKNDSGEVSAGTGNREIRQQPSLTASVRAAENFIIMASACYFIKNRSIPECVLPLASDKTTCIILNPFDPFPSSGKEKPALSCDIPKNKTSWANGMTLAFFNFWYNRWYCQKAPASEQFI